MPGLTLSSLDCSSSVFVHFSSAWRRCANINGGSRIRNPVSQLPWMQGAQNPLQVWRGHFNHQEVAASLRHAFHIMPKRESRKMCKIISRALMQYAGCHGVSVICASYRQHWEESSTLPDVTADLQSIHSALGIAADQRIDFVLIRDDMVARQVWLPHTNEFYWLFLPSENIVYCYFPGLDWP